MSTSPPYLDAVIQGDCLEVMQGLPAACADLVFADPPYFMQTEGFLFRSDGSRFSGVDDAWDKFGGFAEYDAFTRAWLGGCRRLMKEDATLWVIGSFQNIYRLGSILQDMGFWILNDIIWSKPNAVPNFGGTRFQNAHETLLWCARSRDARYIFNYKTMKRLNGGRQARSVWDITLCKGGERLKDGQGAKLHPAQKPEKLLYNVILASTRPEGVVLDPFFGTGTTGAVARLTGRHFIGIERDAAYAEAARQRVAAVQTVHSDIHDQALETRLSRVPMRALVRDGYLENGESLYDRAGRSACTVTERGLVCDGGAPVSIHRMAAIILGRSNANGWDLFRVRRDGALVPLDLLRRRWREDHGGGRG